MNNILITAFSAKDIPGCLEIFDSNVPEFFAPDEREEFAAFLDNPPGPYFVMKQDGGAIIGCGGFAPARNDDGLAVLCWGMIHRRFHRQGLGKVILRHRIDAITAAGSFNNVSIETSPESAGFFNRYNFGTTRIVADGFGAGRDTVKMIRRIA